MNQDFDKFAARAAPAIFVVLWSTGFIGTKYVLHNAEPLTYLAIRMALVVVLMAVIAAIARPQWPDRAGIGAQHRRRAFWCTASISAAPRSRSRMSIPAGLSALIPGLQPILTSTIANRWLGERVTPLQWGGLLLGLAGVVLILHDRPMSGQAGWGWLASGVSLVSITLGTLYQRRYCSRHRLARRQPRAIYRGRPCSLRLGAFLFESSVVHWTAEFVLALVWLAVVLSIGSIGLLYWLIRRSGRDLGREPVLSGAGGDLGDGLCAVRRAARRHRDCRHGRMRGRGVSGQSPRDHEHLVRRGSSA